MARLFNRTVKVTAYATRPGTYATYTTDAIEFTDIRAQFSVEKQLGKDPNSCDVVISNLKADTRAFLQRKPMHIKLDAGHDGEMRHLFSGDVRFCDTKKAGTDRETTLQLGDGDRAFRFATVRRSFAPGTPVRTVLAEAARAMGLVLPDSIAGSEELSTQLALGGAIVGPARDELTRLLAPYGYSWSIQDGTLQILKDGVARPGSALLISRDTGMIGSPEFGPPDKPGGRPSLSVRCLLYPELTPGGLISVQSKDVNGTFRIERVSHTGDTHGDDWTSEIEARPL